MQEWRAKTLHTVGKQGCLLKTLQKALAGLVSAHISAANTPTAISTWPVRTDPPL